MNCPRCGSFALENGTCSKLRCQMMAAHDQGKEGKGFRAQYLNDPPPPRPPGKYCMACGHPDAAYLDRMVPNRRDEELPCCSNKNCGCVHHLVETFEVTAVGFFVELLARMPPAQREATMAELEARVCLWCGVADPECPCWLPEVEGVVF